MQIALQEFNSRSGARACLEVLLNEPPRRARGKLSKRITRIRETTSKVHGLCVIRLLRVIGGDVGERGGSENRIGTTGPRTEAGVRWEVLLNGPPRRARGKLSKRMTRIRVEPVRKLGAVLCDLNGGHA